jgi:hypothetical protein
MIDPVSGAVVGDVCHIRGANPESARYEAAQPERERHAFENLIVLCPTHHRIIDTDERTYTVERLTAIKRRHEAYAPTRVPFEITVPMAKRIRTAMLSGVTVGTAVATAGAIHDLGSALDWLVNLFASKEPRANKIAVRERLSNALRYGPRGHILFASHDPDHVALGRAFVPLFVNAGWIVGYAEPGQLSRLHRQNKPDPYRSLWMAVLVRDVNQLPNAKRAVYELLEQGGFRPLGEEGDYEGIIYAKIRICVMAGQLRR